MEYVKDILWKQGMKAEELMDSLGNVGFQGTELAKAVDIIIKMKKNGSRIFLTFTSNMSTSGLRGFFAQLISLGMVDIIVTTVGGLEEDLMKAKGEKFIIGSFDTDDVQLYEKGVNRVGNLYITNESYCIFEDHISGFLNELFKIKNRWAVSEMLANFGKMIDDSNSILYQAARNKVPVFCPAITDGAFGFHLFMFQQKHPEFMVDVVNDFSNILFSTSHDEKKGLIALGGGVSKHHAILAGLLNGGFDYVVYLTTAHPSSGSMSGATTNEAKSWGKAKDDSDVTTVIGDATLTFPLMMISVLEKLSRDGLIKREESVKDGR